MCESPLDTHLHLDLVVEFGFGVLVIGALAEVTHLVERHKALDGQMLVEEVKVEVGGIFECLLAQEALVMLCYWGECEAEGREIRHLGSHADQLHSLEVLRWVDHEGMSSTQQEYDLHTRVHLQIMTNPPKAYSTDIVPDTLLWTVSPVPPHEKQSAVCFNTQPLTQHISSGISLMDFKQFLEFITHLLKHNSKVVYYCKNNREDVLVGFVVVCFYRLVVLGRSVEEALGCLPALEVGVFGQEGTLNYTYKDVVKCVGRLKGYGFFNKEIPSQVHLQQGSIYCIIPNNIYAFEYKNTRMQLEDKQSHTEIASFCKALKDLNVTEIIGIESQSSFPYNHSQFTLNGIRHHMFTVYSDADPSLHFLTECFSKVKPEGVYAINSQDRFGLSMLFLAAYAIRIFNYTVEEAVCWCRMMVPNSIKNHHVLWLKGKYKTLAGIETYVTAEEALKSIKKNGVVVVTDTYQ